MEPFDGRIGKKLPKEVVSDLRFFGFYIGNETLLLPDITDLSSIYEKSDALGNLFAIKLYSSYSKIAKRGDYTENGSSSLKELVISLNKKQSFRLPPEMKNIRADKNWKASIVRFMLDFGNRKIVDEPLKEYKKDYGDDIINYGNSMEMLTAIYCNVLRMDNDWNVINEDWARYRASQFIRSYQDESFQVIPPFKYWEQLLKL